MNSINQLIITSPQKFLYIPLKTTQQWKKNDLNKKKNFKNIFKKIKERPSGISTTFWRLHCAVFEDHKNNIFYSSRILKFLFWIVIHVQFSLCCAYCFPISHTVYLSSLQVQMYNHNYYKWNIKLNFFLGKMFFISLIYARCFKFSQVWTILPYKIP